MACYRNLSGLREHAYGSGIAAQAEKAAAMISLRLYKKFKNSAVPFGLDVDYEIGEELSSTSLCTCFHWPQGRRITLWH